MEPNFNLSFIQPNITPLSVGTVMPRPQPQPQQVVTRPQPVRTVVQPQQQSQPVRVTNQPKPQQQNQNQKQQQQQNKQPQRNFFEKAWDQVNPFDNGRTFNNGNPQANHQGSVVHQATHNGVANAAGDVVHSFTNVLAAPVNMGRGMVDQFITHNQPAAQRDYNLALKDAHNNIVTGIGEQLKGFGQAGVDLTKENLDMNNQAKSNADNAAFVRDINKTPFGQVLDPIQHKLAEYQVNRDLKGQSKQVKQAVLNRNEAAAGLDPGASTGKQLLTSGLAAAQLAVPEKVVNGVPIKEDLAAKGAVVADNARALKTSIASKTTPLNESGAARIPKPNFTGGSHPSFRASGGPQISMTSADLKQAAEDSKLSPEEKGNLPADRQMKLNQFENGKPMSNKQLGQKKLAEADAANPVKVNLPSVNPNDKFAFEHARTIPQVAAEPVKAATYVAAKSAKQSGLSVSDLADRVEHPEDYPNMVPKEAQAVNDWKYLTNLVNATSHQLNGKEARIDNFFKHAIDTQDWAHTGESPVFDAKTGKVADANSFNGVDAISRKTNEDGTFKYPDLRSLHDAGMKLQNEDNIEKFISSYGGSAAYKLEKQALVKSFQEADGGAEAGAKTEALNLHDGKPLMLSKEAYKQARSYMHEDSSTLGKIIDKPNSAMKHILLSASQYHPTNINLLQAAPSLVLQGHPLRAAMGVRDTVANAFSKTRSLDQMRQDLHSGLIQKSAQIGSPLYKTDFTANGQTSKMGQMVFGRQIPAMHRQVNMATLKDLNRMYGSDATGEADLTSHQARQAGMVANNTMGFINAKVHNLDPRLQRTVSRFLLAPQFEMSKLNLVKAALDPRTPLLARRNAVATIFGKYAAEAGLSLGVGAALGQKQDNTKDILTQNLLNPSIPTPLKNSKGDTIKFKLPDSGASEVGNLVLNTDRNPQTGRIQVNFNPGNAPGQLVTDVRQKFSPGFAAGVKVATGKNYAGQPIRQQNAPAGTQAEQTAVSTAQDLLPIGLQGVPYLNAVESHLPGGVQTILNANKPGTNPFFKSALTTVAATPEVDTTTGKGQQTSQYYNALDKALNSLPANSPERGAFLESFGVTKDPVTGQYLMTPNSEMTVAKAASLNAYPAAAKAANVMAQQLKAEGQKVDPYYLLSPDQQKAYNAYMTMAPLSGDRTDWQNKNPWYKNFQTQEQNFFSSLPKGDPNKPANPVKFPDQTKQITSLMTQYDSLPKGSTAASDWLSSPQAQPLVDYFNAVTNYDNAVRQVRGYAPVKQVANATPQVQAFIKTYDAASKADRTTLRTNQPGLYQQMIAQYDNQDLASVDKQAAVSQLSGEPDYTSKELKDMASLATDTYQTGVDSSGKPVYSIVPAGWMNGGVSLDKANSSGSGSSSSYTKSQAQYYANSTLTNLENGVLGNMDKSANLFKQTASTSLKAPSFSPKSAGIKGFKAPKGSRVAKVKEPKGLKPERAPKMPKAKISHLRKNYSLTI